ncbi:4860_t:CDS:2, partial [Entrophospora sp. SA101]
MIDCLHVVNIDDFHDVHEKKRPDTTSLSTVKHFASCVSKKVECPPVLAINNGIHVHNPNNIEGNKIKDYLNTKYKEIFDISYSVRKREWISNDLNTFNSFNNEKLPTVHVYCDLIRGKHEEISMND